MKRVNFDEASESLSRVRFYGGEHLELFGDAVKIATARKGEARCMA